MEGANSVTKNTTYLTLAYIGQKILSFFYFVLVARALGVEGLGKYTFAMSFTALFAVLIDCGLNSALIRETAKFPEKAKQYLSSILSTKIFFSFFAYGLVVLIVNLLGYPAVTKQLVYLSGIPMIFDQLTNTFWAIFRGRQNLRQESINIVYNQLVVFAVGIAVIVCRLPLIYFILPFILASLFSFFYSALSVWHKCKIHYSLRFEWPALKFIFKIAIPFALIAIFSRVYSNLDAVLISKLAGDKALGWYGVAMKVPFALQFIPAALSAAVFPAFSRHFLYNKEQLRLTFERVMKLLLLIVAPISAGIAILAQPIVLFFYGSEYAASASPLQIMMAGLVFVFLNYALGALLNACNYQITNTVLAGITMILNVVLNVLLIPRFGFVGASWAFLGSHALLFCVSLFFAGRIVRFSPSNLLLVAIKICAAAGLMGLSVAALLPKIHFLMTIPIGAAVYGLAVFTFRAIKLNEIKRIKLPIFKS